MDLLSLIAAPVLSRAAPYMVRARWRSGPLGRPVPTAPRQLPRLDPIVNAYGSRRERRAARAARIASRR